MNETLEVIWAYEPKDLFEEKFEHGLDRGRVVLEDGRVTAHLLGPGSEGEALDMQGLFDAVEGLLAAMSVISHRAYKMPRSGYTLIRQQEDGTRDVSVGLSPADIVLTGNKVRVVITEPPGHVVGDSSAAQIREHEEFVRLAAGHLDRDATAAAIIRSYVKAVNDPENELIHLYEILEALEKIFKGQVGVRDNLGVTRRKIRRLHQLADIELREGRHRGQYVGQLRAASPKELAEARKIASGLIKAYLEYLDSSLP